MAKYRGNPFMGISPKLKFVNVFIDNFSAFSILVKTSRITAIKNILNKSINLKKHFCIGKSLLVFSNTIFFRSSKRMKLVLSLAGKLQSLTHIFGSNIKMKSVLFLFILTKYNILN